jgi:hypothetical protein
MTATEDRMREAFDADTSRPLVQIAASVAEEMVAEATAEQAAHLDVMSTYVETGKKIAAAREKQLATLGKQHAEMLAALKAARQFILNGIEMGFIRLPASDADTANRTVPIIDAAIDRAEGR